MMNKLDQSSFLDKYFIYLSIIYCSCFLFVQLTHGQCVECSRDFSHHHAPSRALFVAVLRSCLILFYLLFLV